MAHIHCHASTLERLVGQGGMPTFTANLGWHTYSGTHTVAHIQWHTCTLNRGCGGVDVYVHWHLQNQAWHIYTLNKYTLNRYTLNRGWGDGGVYFGSSKTAANRCNLLRVTVHEPPIRDRCWLAQEQQKKKHTID